MLSAACTSYGESSQYKFTWAADAAIAGEAQSVSQHPLTPLILIEYLIPTVSARILPCFLATLRLLDHSENGLLFQLHRGRLGRLQRAVRRGDPEAARRVQDLPRVLQDDRHARGLQVPRAQARRDGDLLRRFVLLRL